MAYVVSLKQFDGPLDLLLTLIARAKVDICDIFVSEITEQYLASMAGVDELDMDSASEFLQMASTLVEIKSRALLPSPPEPEDPDAETPEQALIRQLTEYKAFKEASEDMKRLEESARLLLSKLPEEYPLPPPAFELTGMTLDGLAKAFARVLSRLNEPETPPKQREIRRDSYTVQTCMFKITSRLRQGKVSFDSLFDDEPCREEIVGLFMAMLELLRLNRLTLRQEGVYGEITLFPISKRSSVEPG